MITVDARCKDGSSAVADLQFSSPTGGFCQSRSVRAGELRPGDVIRDSLGWFVISGVRHDGIHGLSTVAMIGADGSTWRRTLTSGESREIRTDARIDPDTLYKLVTAAD